MAAVARCRARSLILRFGAPPPSVWRPERGTLARRADVARAVRPGPASRLWLISCSASSCSALNAFVSVLPPTAALHALTAGAIGTMTLASGRPPRSAIPGTRSPLDPGGVAVYARVAHAPLGGKLWHCSRWPAPHYRARSAFSCVALIRRSPGRAFSAGISRGRRDAHLLRARAQRAQRLPITRTAGHQPGRCARSTRLCVLPDSPGLPSGCYQAGREMVGSVSARAGFCHHGGHLSHLRYAPARQGRICNSLWPHSAPRLQISGWTHRTGEGQTECRVERRGARRLFSRRFSRLLR